jgi:hypothetical protein
VKIKSVLCNAFIALAGLGLLFLPMASRASVGTGMASVPLAYSGPETLFLGASVSTGTVTFPLGGGTANSIISISIEYTLNQGRVLTIEAGFNSTTALTDGIGDQIPTQAIGAIFSSGDGGLVNNFGSCNGPASGQTQIFASSCGYVTYAPVLLGQTTGSHNDTMQLSLNPTFSAPGNYTGVLLISAQAN